MCSRQGFNSRGKVVLPARNHLGGFWETLRLQEMVAKVLPAPQGNALGLELP